MIDKLKCFEFIFFLLLFQRSCFICSFEIQLVKQNIKSLCFYQHLWEFSAEIDLLICNPSRIVFLEKIWLILSLVDSCFCYFGCIRVNSIRYWNIYSYQLNHNVRYSIYWIYKLSQLVFFFGIENNIFHWKKCFSPSLKNKSSLSIFDFIKTLEPMAHQIVLHPSKKPVVVRSMV